VKKGKREVSFLDLQRCQRRGEKWKEKKSTLLSFKLKNQKNVFPSASLPLRGARRGGLCPAGTCSLSLSLSHSRRFHLRVGLAPLRAVYRAFPRAELSNGCEEEGFIQCSNESFSPFFSSKTRPSNRPTPSGSSSS